MASEAIRSELKKLPIITKNGIERDVSNCAPNCAPISDSDCQAASEAGKSVFETGSRKYANCPLKSRVVAALDTIWQNLEMVDATGLEPVTPCV